MGQMILAGLDALEYWEWPANAAGVVVSTLRNREGDNDQRLLAVKLAAEAACEAVIARELLARCRDNEDDEVIRAQAATSLGVTLATFDLDGGFDDAFAWDDDESSITAEFAREIQNVLHAIWADDSESLLVRRRALEGSVRCPEDWHAAAVKQAWEADDDDMRMTAVFCMHYVGGFESEMLESLRDDRIWVQIHAIRAAGAREIRQAWPAVKEILKAGNPGGDCSNPAKVRYLTAIEVLPCVAKKSVANEWLDELCDSPDEDVAATAEETRDLGGSGLWL